MVAPLRVLNLSLLPFLSLFQGSVGLWLFAAACAALGCVVVGPFGMAASTQLCNLHTVQLVVTLLLKLQQLWPWLAWLFSDHAVPACICIVWLHMLQVPQTRMEWVGELPPVRTQPLLV